MTDPQTETETETWTDREKQRELKDRAEWGGRSIEVLFAQTPPKFNL